MSSRYKIVDSGRELEDKYEECKAYMKTKKFMAKRIAEQQEEIEELKQELIFQSSKHCQMLEWMKQMTEVLNEKKKNSSNDDNNLSLSCDLAMSEVGEDEKKEEVVTKNEAIAFHEIKNENIELRKQLEKFKIALIDNQAKVTKLTTEKFLLFNELSELVQSLKKVDLDSLNDFYINQTAAFKKKITQLDLPSSMGLKYNILSANDQLMSFMDKRASDLIKNNKESNQSRIIKYDSLRTNSDTVLNYNFNESFTNNIVISDSKMIKYDDILNRFISEYNDSL